MTIQELYQNLFNTPIDRTDDWEYLEILYEYTLKHRSELVLETGTYTGKSAIAVATAMRSNEKGHIITFDNREWTPQQLRQGGKHYVDVALERFASLKFTNIEFIEGDCLAPPERIKQQRYDFIFLDTIHNYPQVKAELALYSSLTDDIFVHDCESPSDDGSGKAVLEFIKTNKEWKLNKLGTKWGLWYIHKGPRTLVMTTATDKLLMETWLPSLRNKGKYTGDVLVLDYDLSSTTVDKLKDSKIQVEKRKQTQDWIVCDRYKAYYEYLKNLYRTYDTIMIVDGCDIEFLKPIQPLFEMARETVCYVKEKTLNKEWRWSRNPIFSQEIWNSMMDQPIINGGMYIGPSDLVFKIVAYVVENLIYDNGFGFDQSLLNAMIYYYRIPSQEVEEIWNYDPRKESISIEKVAIVHRINSFVSKPKERNLKICYYPAYGIESGSSRQRVFYIAEKLREWGHEVWFQSAPLMADVIIVQKLIDILPIVKEARSRGIPIVFDYCDPGPWDGMIKEANIVTADSQGLLDQYHVESKGRVVLNPIDLLEKPLLRRNHTKTTGLDIVYFAFPVNLGAFAHCKGVLERLRKEGYDFTFTYISGGQTEKPFQGFDHKFVQWNYETFSQELQKYDIAIIPQEYDWKGPNKQVDACAHNVPAVCERTLPNTALYQEAGLEEYLAKTEDEWYNAIKKLMDPEERNKFLDKVGPVVWKKHSRDAIVKDWLNLFKELIKK